MTAAIVAFLVGLALGIVFGMAAQWAIDLPKDYRR